MSRRATKFNKRDGSEPEILAALAKLGVTWIESGPLDGWIAINGRFIPVELKSTDGRLTQGQKAFIAHCERDGLPYRIWRHANDAIESVNLWRNGG